MAGAVVARVAPGQQGPVGTSRGTSASEAFARAGCERSPGGNGLDPLQRPLRWIFGIAAVLAAALIVSLAVRPVGSYVDLIDGWGVAAFELSMGALCIARFYEASWRTSTSAARLFPLLIGVACLSWGLGKAVLTLESLGGATPPTPSPADVFFVCFFPICFMGLAVLIERGNRNSLVSTSLDGLVAGLGVAALSAAVVVAAVTNMTGGSPLATATHLAYPLGDILLLPLAVGGFAVLPRGFRPFFAIVCVALASNAIGDAFNLLQPDEPLRVHRPAVRPGRSP